MAIRRALTFVRRLYDPRTVCWKVFDGWRNYYNVQCTASAWVRDVSRRGRTHTVDIWSLHVTMLRTLNVQCFKRQSEYFKSFPDARQAILAAIFKAGIIQEVARVNPDERASTAQMLVKRHDH
ncbi:hypothetical protein BJ170DRAFT_615088 [Xylariales sp. AK1849]|nr:hypothetical protein BJ170DRAFT_615088 [Xylariales sp. AK1849]